MSRNTVLDEHIIDIIRRRNIDEQSVLQNTLRERGFHIPQATLSRRLKKLGIAKILGTYKVVDSQKTHLPLVLGLCVSEFGLIILHTHPGNASSVAYFIDQKYVNCQAKNPGILGTIAGDDTVLIITQGKKHLRHVLTILHQTFPYLDAPSIPTNIQMTHS